MKQIQTKLSQYFQEFWKYRDLLKLLVSKNIKLKYRRSWLGYVWSILNPLLIMVVMTIVFSTMFKRNIENFPVYLFCGQLLFNYMNTSTSQAIFSITGNASLLKKTFVPKYLFPMCILILDSQTPLQDPYYPIMLFHLYQPQILNLSNYSLVVLS